jgi:hypothetical protein
MLLLAFFSQAQNNTTINNKLQKIHQKNLKIIQKTEKISNLLKTNFADIELLAMKSAAAKQKLDSTVSRVLNADTQTWQYNSKDEFIYDSNLKNTSWLSKEWNQATKNWDILTKTDLLYDNHNRVNSMIIWERDSLNNDIIPNSKTVVYYNSEGLQDSILSFHTEDAGVNWLLDVKQINYFNASKKVTRVDVWALDEEQGELILSMNVIYTYTATGGIKTSTTNYVMENEEITWSKSVYNYDGSGILTSIEDWQLNFMTFSLEKTSRNSYQYNAAGDVSVDTYSSWNGVSWVDEEKDESTYNTTNFTEIVFPSFIGLLGIGVSTELNYNKVITGTNTFEMLNGSWKNTGKLVFYYSGGTSTGIEENGTNMFSVYPNPASDLVSFRWKGNYENLNLQMYQITGVKALEQMTFPGEIISISRLENGIYFFKLLNGNQIVNAGKLIKR